MDQFFSDCHHYYHYRLSYYYYYYESNFFSFWSRNKKKNILWALIYWQCQVMRTRKKMENGTKYNEIKLHYLKKNLIHKRKQKRNGMENHHLYFSFFSGLVFKPEKKEHFNWKKIVFVSTIVNRSNQCIHCRFHVILIIIIDMNE